MCRSAKDGSELNYYERVENELAEAVGLEQGVGVREVFAVVVD